MDSEIHDRFEAFLNHIMKHDLIVMCCGESGVMTYDFSTDEFRVGHQFFKLLDIAEIVFRASGSVAIELQD
jgi:hypothetical protein